jgi:hypothetical protein
MKDTKEGQGVQISDGNVYVGSFVKGLKVGKGIIKFKNGERYEGLF